MPGSPIRVVDEVGQELRSRNEFTGVTITDALEAGARCDHSSTGDHGSTGDRAVLAAEAGYDLILASARDVTQGDEAAEALAVALTEGALDDAAFADALTRINALRASLG